MLQTYSLLSLPVSTGSRTFQFLRFSFAVWDGLSLCRLPKGQVGISGFADDLEALEMTDFFREENRQAPVKSITQQEALENYKNVYDAEGNEQEMPAKQKRTGKKRTPGTACGKKPNYSLFLWLFFFFFFLIPVHCVHVQVLAFNTLFPFKCANSCTQPKKLIEENIWRLTFLWL